MDAFVNIENVGVDLLAKTFQPLVSKSADYNFTETSAFLSMVSKTAKRNPRGMGRLAAKLTSIDPQVRQDFAEVSLQVSQRASEAETASADESQPAYRQSRPPATQHRR